MEEQTIIKQQVESVKLSKMSKGYQWEIRIISTNEDGIITIGDLQRLDKTNTELERRWGNGD